MLPTTIITHIKVNGSTPVAGYRYVWNSGFWTLDYSRAGPEEFQSLPELSLSEFGGIGTGGGIYSNYWMPFGVSVVQGPAVVRAVRFAPLNGTPVDFGDPDGTGFQDGQLDFSIVQDLNFVADPPPGIIPGTPRRSLLR